MANELDTGEAEMLITVTADIVSAHVANNTIAVDDVPRLLRCLELAARKYERVPI